MEEDRTHWRDVNVDNKTCWMNKGVYLGKCTSKGKSGPDWDPDPWFKFEKGGVYYGIDLKFTKVNCRDEEPKKKSSFNNFFRFFSPKPPREISGGRKYKKKTIKKKRHSKKNKHTKSKKRFKK